MSTTLPAPQNAGPAEAEAAADAVARGLAALNLGPAPALGGWNPVGLHALASREVKRTWAIINQVVWPPVISTLLYVLVIGMGLGASVPQPLGVPYLAFLLPGLMALTIVESSYGECSSSLFQLRFMNAIQELLTAPLASWELVAGFLVGSLTRAFILVGMLIPFLPVFAGMWPQHVIPFVVMTALISIGFSGLGLIAGLLGEKWDQIAIPQTFLFTPLIWVGGVFTPPDMLPKAMQGLVWWNPLFYMIDGLRYGLVGAHAAPLWASFGLGAAFAASGAGVALWLFHTSSKLRP